MSGSAASAATPPAGVTVKFIKHPQVGPSNHGVTINTSTGQVNVAASSPLANFLIYAQVTDTNIPEPNNRFEAPIRVNIHNSITDLWLTPSPLTIRRATSGIRFSVLARFDDGTIGTIPPISGVTWKSSKPVDVPVDPATGAISAPLGSNTNSAQITATLPPFLGNKVTNGDVRVEKSWSTPTEATLIRGKPSKRNENFNFLFIPDGFTVNDKKIFFQLVNDLVKKLTTRVALGPFNLLSDSINYWSTFIPSRENGLSALYDMGIDDFGGNDILGHDNIPFPKRPRPTTPPKVWELEELVHEVGLPIPADKANIDLVDPEFEKKVEEAFKAKLIQWVNLFGPDISGHVDKGLYWNWQEMSGHQITNEKDTAFGLALGDRPRVHDEQPGRGIGLHPFRTNRSHLDQFLSKITYKGDDIGETWTTGKSHDLVFVLCGGSRSGGQMTPSSGIAASSLWEEDIVMLKKESVNPSYGIESYPIPSSIDSGTLSTVAHESAHLLGVDDEYGGRPRLPDTRIQFLMGNLQDEKSLLSAGKIDGTKIKWLWPRISKAGVLVWADHLGGDLVRIFLKRKHTQFFEKDDLARLRRRPLLQFPNPSARLKISRVDKEGDFIDVIVPSGVNIEDMLDNFVNIPSSSERSILIVPTPGPSSTGELPLVAPNIREHINTTHGPLTAPIGDPTRTCNLDKVSSEGMQSPTNIPNNLPRGRPIFKPWIVGIYEGGNTYNCGVYHPSGICIMRTQLVPQFTESNVIVIDLTSPQDRLYRVPPKRAIYQFCIVCQYILVDKIDPTKHHDVDNEYRRRGYPFPL